MDDKEQSGMNSAWPEYPRGVGKSKIQFNGWELLSATRVQKSGRQGTWILVLGRDRETSQGRRWLWAKEMWKGVKGCRVPLFFDGLKPSLGMEPLGLQYVEEWGLLVCLDKGAGSEDGKGFYTTRSFVSPKTKTDTGVPIIADPERFVVQVNKANELSADEIRGVIVCAVARAIFAISDTNMRNMFVCPHRRDGNVYSCDENDIQPRLLDLSLEDRSRPLPFIDYLFLRSAKSLPKKHKDLLVQWLEKNQEKEVAGMIRRIISVIEDVHKDLGPWEEHRPKMLDFAKFLLRTVVAF